MPKRITVGLLIFLNLSIARIMPQWSGLLDIISLKARCSLRRTSPRKRDTPF